MELPLRPYLRLAFGRSRAIGSLADQNGRPSTKHRSVQVHVLGVEIVHVGLCLSTVIQSS